MCYAWSGEEVLFLYDASLLASMFILQHIGSNFCIFHKILSPAKARTAVLFRDHPVVFITAPMVAMERTELSPVPQQMWFKAVDLAEFASSMNPGSSKFPIFLNFWKFFCLLLATQNFALFHFAFIFFFRKVDTFKN